MSGFIDGHYIHMLTKHLALLDTELIKITNAVAKSVDSDGDGLCDQGEYFIGYGFIAIQGYMTATRTNLRITVNQP